MKQPIVTEETVHDGFNVHLPQNEIHDMARLPLRRDA